MQRSREIAYLSQHALVLLHDRVLKLDCRRLDDLLLLFLLVVLGGFGKSSLSTSLSVSLESRFDDSFDQVIGSEDLSGLGILDHPVGESEDRARRI